MFHRFIRVFICVLALVITDKTWAQCVVNTGYTMSPPPTNGQYDLGQTVEICGSFSYTEAGAIWVHGIVPLIPAGWDVGSIQLDPPASCSGTGTWGWYNSVTGTAGSAGTHGPGFFYDTGNDGNPGNNFGDNCFGGTFNFCITLTTTDDCQGGALDETNLNITFQILGDNASGAWNNFSCPTNGNPLPPPPALNATLNCCEGEDIDATFCADDPMQNLFALFTESPPGGTWQTPTGGNFNGNFTPGTNADGIYSYSFDTGDCEAVSTVNVTTVEPPDAGTGQNITVCEGESAFDLFDQIISGDAGGSWTDPLGNATGAAFTPGLSEPGIYTYTVQGNSVCPPSQTVVIVTVDPNPSAGDDGNLTLCSSSAPALLFDALNGAPEPGGSWTDPAGNPSDEFFDPAADAEGIYTYTAGIAPCTSQASVTVSVTTLPFAGNDVDFEICSNGQPANLSVLLPGAEPGGNWLNPAGLPHDGNFNPATDSPGTYLYEVGAPGCSDVAEVNITVNNAPEGTVSAPDFCEGSDLEIEFNLTGTGPFDLEYSINGTTSTASGVSSGYSTSITPPGNVTIILESITDLATGCTSSGNTIIANSIPTPTANLVGGDNICDNEEGTITFELTGNGPFDVVYTDGTSNFSLNGIPNGHTITVNPSTSTTYTLVSVEDNTPDACEGLVSGIAVFEVTTAPSGTITGSSSICVGENAVITFNLTGNGPFNVVYSDGVSDFTLLNINDGHTETVTPLTSTTYELISVLSTDNPNCAGSVDGTAEITIATAPSFSNLTAVCNDTNEDYVVSFEISGGDPASYEVSGGSGSISGGTFTSAEIASGDAYSFFLDDGNGCGPVEISGTFECDCATNAGTMNLTAIEACENEPLNAVHNGNEFLDGNDVLVFVLHNGTANALGDILAESSTPVFDFGAGLQTGVTYYVAALAGNAIGGNSVNLNDPCLSVSPGVPVSFIAEPTAAIAGSSSICAGEPASIEVTLTGNGLWDVEYALNGVADGNFSTSQNNFLLEVSEGGTYTLISVTDSQCSGSVSGTAEIQEFETPEATILNGGDFCAGSGDGPLIELEGSAPWLVAYTINDGPLQTVNISSSPFTLEATESGEYTLISVEDANCEGIAAGSTNVVVHPIPIAGISGGGQICEGDETSIIFNGEGTGDVTIAYAINGLPAGNATLEDGSYVLMTDVPGEYTITSVTDQYCAGQGDGSSASLTVNPLPTALMQLTPNPYCEGDSALLSVSFTGNGPFNLVYQIGEETISASNVFSVSEYITSPNGAQISLLAVEDNSNPTCNQTLDQIITAQVLPAPDPPSLTDIFRCNSDSFPHIGINPVPGLSYSWSPQTGLTNPFISDPILLLNNDGTEPETLLYTLTASNGICAASTTMEITIDPGPQVDFSYLPRPVTTETTTVNFFNTTSGINNYLWTFDNLGSAESTNATFTFPDGIEGNYAVTLFAENPETGCNNELTRIIDVVGQLIVYVPNAFTPNGDGINELFAPVVRNFRPETYEFSIYSRNGELIFKSQDPEEKWNGSVAGSQYFAQNEVYVWQLQVGDIFSTETKKFNGKVTVIR